MLGRSQQKTVHVTMHALAVAIAAGGVMAAWKSHSLKRPVPTENLYSLHSWLVRYRYLPKNVSWE